MKLSNLEMKLSNLEMILKTNFNGKLLKPILIK